MTAGKTRLIVGAGYLGLRVARAWQAAGDRVIVCTRSKIRAAAWRTEGLDSRVLDVTRPDTLESAFPAVDTLLYAVGFDRHAGADRRAVYVEGLRNVLEALPEVADRLIYVSSTGVHGEQSGEWVNEETPPQPSREAGIVCWDAEQVLMQSRWASRSVRFRMAGIYGPGRIPLAESIRQGQSLPVATDAYLNLIHVEDAVAAVLAADRCALPSLYLVSDGHPVLRGEFYGEVARRLGLEVRWADPDSGSGRAERGGDNKRISNRRLLSDLLPSLRYPSYREGIAVSLESTHV
jgi:nucleoside-diphosphate-sugar epimerase